MKIEQVTPQVTAAPARYNILVVDSFLSFFVLFLREELEFCKTSYVKKFH